MLRVTTSSPAHEALLFLVGQALGALVFPAVLRQFVHQRLQRAGEFRGALEALDLRRALGRGDDLVFVERHCSRLLTGFAGV
jgi:hypothetical protein